MFRDASFAASGGSMVGVDIDEEEMARMEEVLNTPADEASASEVSARSLYHDTYADTIMLPLLLHVLGFR